MTSKDFVNILIEQVLKNDVDMYKKAYIEKQYDRDFQDILDSFNDDERKNLFNMFNLVIQNSIAGTLSIIDQWGGGYFDDKKDNDGHFELYYVSDEKGKYKYRVDENSCDLFLEKMELLNKNSK